jgi:hypothetical protein
MFADYPCLFCRGPAVADMGWGSALQWQTVAASLITQGKNSGYRHGKWPVEGATAIGQTCKNFITGRRHAVVPDNRVT